MKEGNRSPVVNCKLNRYVIWLAIANNDIRFSFLVPSLVSLLPANTLYDQQGHSGE